MLRQLKAAGETLRTSIEAYVAISSAVQNDIIKGNILSGLLPELSSCLESEFGFITSLEQKLRQARASIGQVHNYCNRVSPINRLPSEILTRIFHLVSADPCHLCPQDLPADFSRYLNSNSYPDQLAHVCSRWRKVAISSPFLWTHIDLTPHATAGRRLFGRQVAYESRSNHIALDIHLDDRGCTSSASYDVKMILSHLASRAKSLEFIIISDKIQSFHSSALKSIISKCSPQNFKKLCVHSDVFFPNPFVSDSNLEIPLDADRPPKILRWTERQMDAKLLGITTLHLQGVFFYWSSMLYHGLVDLRLSSPPKTNPYHISSSSLVMILSASPELKILHFSLELLANEAPGDEPNSSAINPVPLQNLEVLHVSTIRARDSRRSAFPIGSFFELLAPGSKPLRLTIHTPGKPSDTVFGNATRAFFARSNVERLSIRTSALLVTKPFWLCDMPDLKVLVLDSSFPLFKLEESSHPIPALISLTVYLCVLTLPQLRSLLRLCPSRIILYHAVVLDDAESGLLPDAEVRAAFPMVEFVTEDSAHHPTADWDIVD
ncbi:hypothetical protein ACGC1H_000307 [Rhizoctonia solani]